MFARAFFQGSYWFASCMWALRHVHEIESPSCQRAYLSPRTKHAATATKLCRKFASFNSHLQREEDETNNEDNQFAIEEPESYIENSNSVSSFRLTTEYPAIRAGYADTQPKKKGGGLPFSQTPPSRPPSFNTFFIPPLPSVRIQSAAFSGYTDMQSRQDYSYVFFGLSFHYTAKCHNHILLLFFNQLWVNEWRQILLKHWVYNSIYVLLMSE